MLWFLFVITPILLKYFKSLDSAIKILCFFKPSSRKSTKLIARATAPQCFFFLFLFKEVWCLLLATQISFLLLKAKYQTQIVERPKFKPYLHTAKALSSPEHIYKNVEHHGKRTSLGVKDDKPKSTY